MTRKKRKHLHKHSSTDPTTPRPALALTFPTDPANVQIDGSVHEGGGQMVRTALGLAGATGVSVHVSNVRAGRSTPGLRQQHVTGTVLTDLVSGGAVYGAQVGSLAVPYDPPAEASAACTDDVLNAPLGSAGAAALVFQAALPALAVHSSGREVHLAGGTHVPSSPTAEYVTHVLCKVAKKFRWYGTASFPVGAGWRQCRRAQIVRVRGWVVPAMSALVASGAADRMRKAARRTLRNGFGDRFESCKEKELLIEVMDVDGNAKYGSSLSMTLVADTADGGAIGSSLTLDPHATRECLCGELVLAVAAFTCKVACGGVK